MGSSKPVSPEARVISVAGRLTDCWRGGTETSSALAELLEAVRMLENKQHTSETCDQWNDVEACIEEIHWFVSRKKDLSAPCNEIKAGERTWADVLDTDISDLRAAIREARGQPAEAKTAAQKAVSVETLPKPWTMGGDLNGTHLVGYANVLYSRIVEVFGEPTETDFSEGSRVVFNWTITFADGTVASIYEYKCSSLYGDGDDAPTPEEMKRSFTDWHIGGKSQRAVELVTNALSEGEV